MQYVQKQIQAKRREISNVLPRAPFSDKMSGGFPSLSHSWGKRVELAGVPAAGGSAAKLQQPLSENMTAVRDSPSTRG